VKPELQAQFIRRFAGGAVVCVEKLCLDTGNFGVTVLFGASGSGKTTILKCLAGLERPDEGRVAFANEVWSDAAAGIFLKPQRRRIGYVPQDFALFPHLTVARNVAFGLRALPAAERDERVTQTMTLLGIAGLESRLPQELSGGQQQRVALARAVVTRPCLLLLDEPLSALDTPLRQRLRGELRTLLARLDVPTLLVTHDRFEALALGDEIIVLDQGRILQRGPVNEVFNRPASLAVAGIVGTDTVLDGRVLQIADSLATIAVGGVHLTALAEDLAPNTASVHLCIRAEDVILVKDSNPPASARNRLDATVQRLVAEGPLVRIELDCGFPLKALLTRQACAELALQPGTTIVAMIKAPHVHLIPFQN
jgi:molybdate transport system ATP-binding protein